MCLMRWLAPALAALSLVAAPAHAKVRVVTSIETFADLARRVGGDRVEVQALSRGYMDPHFVEAKPNLQVVLNRADLLVHVGLELEIGWLPLLVLGSRNPRIQTGGAGDLDASTSIAVLDVPTVKVDRSMGDIHPRGNPHYWLPPDNALVIAGEVAARLRQIDPDGAAAYDAHLAAFRAEVARRRAVWEKDAAPLRGLKVVTYHKSWSYLSAWLGLVEIGYIEPKPGIPPSQSHVAQLVQQMRAEGARVVMMESFYSRNTAQFVAKLAGGKLAVLPSDVGATPEVRDYFGLVDAVIRAMLEAAR
jgi:zinc/manganese transport system substrate-binding protein